MPYINVRDFRVNAGSVLNELQQDREPRIVLRRGKPVAVLLPADEDAVETTAFFRRARAQLAVRAIREEARRRGLDRMTARQVEALVERARRPHSR